MSDLPALLQAAIRSGEWDDVRTRMADDVQLVSSGAGGIVRPQGPEAVVAHLSAAGPGDVAVWDAREHAHGVALTFEWHGRTRDRRRWYVRTAPDGTVERFVVYTAAPKEAAPREIPAPVLERLRARPAGDLEHGGNSGAALLRAEAADGTPLILKHCAPGADWLGRVTGDEGRSGLLWAGGVMRELEDVIETGIVDAVEHEGDWWLAMRDVGPSLLGEGRLSREDARRILAAAAAIHQRFRGRPPHGAATLQARLGMSGPGVAEAERSSSDLLPKQLELAWEAFAEVFPPDVAEPVLALAHRPGLLADALLAAAPPTLVHGDLRDDNLGFAGDRVVLLDWDLATAGTPTVDYAWFALQDAWRIDASRDDLLADYRSAEAELEEAEVRLGLLSGLVQYGWLLGHSAAVHPDPAEREWALAERDWWVPHARAALADPGVPGL